MKKEIQQILSNQIKENRVRQKLTQQQLADLVNVTTRTIISLEKGQYNPSVLLAYNLSKVFNMTIEELFNFEEENYE